MTKTETSVLKEKCTTPPATVQSLIDHPKPMLKAVFLPHKYTGKNKLKRQHFIQIRVDKMKGLK